MCLFHAVALLTLAVAFSSLPAAATTLPNETDYPVQYAVMNTIKVNGFMIGNFCTMSVHDQAAPNITFVVQRKSHGACHVWDSGTVSHGRREKNSIKLLAKSDKGELKIEDWPITATLDTGLPAK